MGPWPELGFNIQANRLGRAKEVDELEFNLLPVSGRAVHLPNSFDTEVRDGMARAIEVFTHWGRAVVADRSMMLKKTERQGSFGFSHVEFWTLLA